MEYIVDLQGFQQPINEFVVKELAVMHLQSPHHVTHLYEPPCVWESLPPKYKTTNNWLTRHFHGLEWNEGYFPYDELKSALKSMLFGASCVYVKGVEKKLFLQKLLKNKFYIIDLTDADCPSLQKLSLMSETELDTCPNHWYKCSKLECALKNVQLMKNWICENSFDE